MGTRWKRIFRSGLIASIGFMLSPLSWWNDLFINVPLALGFAWLVSAVWPKAFTAAFVAGYWMTNVVGLILLRRGATELAAGSKPTFSRKEIVKDIAVALAYT
ncbi:MAG: hypothetical protein ACP5MD_08285, partial [Verrucomicrobiia bacterium]